MLEEPLVHTVSNPEDYSPEKPKEIISSTPKKCVCEICTCGMHHCPRPRLRGIFETTYKHDFQKYAMKRPPPQIPREQYKARHYDKSTLVTSYDDYNKTSELIKRRSEERAAHQSQNKYQTSIFENSAKALLRERPKFIGVSEYKDHFKQFQQREKSLPSHFSMQNIPTRFEGESSYKKDYKPYLSAVAKNLESIKVEIPSSPSIKHQLLSPQANSSELLGQNIEGSGKRVKTMGDVYSSYKCPCQFLRLPSSNNTDHLHLKYDPIKKEWQ